MTHRIETLAEGVTLHCGDCREILPTLGKVDACVTDPPYGVNFKYASHVDSLASWKALMVDLVGWARANTTCAVMPSCQIKELPWIYGNIPPDWLICWFKGSPGHAAVIGFNDWEPLLVYGKPANFPIHDYFYAQPAAPNGHPCPKPVEWAKWIISRVSKLADIIVDPFLGSGTTGVAAVNLGRKFIGIEIEQRYFDIACRRIQDALDRPDMFVERPKPAKQLAWDEMWAAPFDHPELIKGNGA